MPLKSISIKKQVEERLQKFFVGNRRGKPKNQQPLIKQLYEQIDGNPHSSSTLEIGSGLAYTSIDHKT